jgi:FixJ family two-component response regulator/DNA-binding transcriptional ArsR family regulator
MPDEKSLRIPPHIKKIMFVDDDLSILDAAKTAIESYGYEVITASSGQQCLEKLDSANLVFLDIKMPKMDGIETLKRIKQRRPTLPVIMITAYATVDTAIEAMKEGAYDYIRKPFDVDDLEGSILAALEEIKFQKLKHVELKGDDFITKFNELTSHQKGLSIAKDAAGTYGLENVELISLQRDWRPRDAEDLRAEIETKLSLGIVVLLSNLEYLLEGNSIADLRSFLKWLYRAISAQKGTLILSADLEKVEQNTAFDIRNLIADIRLGLFSESISNYLRRQVIHLLSDGSKCSFTKIAQNLGIKDNPKLSFHLKKLRDDRVIEQDEDKRYSLSTVGREIADILAEIRERGDQTSDLIWISSGL